MPALLYFYDTEIGRRGRKVVTRNESYLFLNTLKVLFYLHHNQRIKDNQNLCKSKSIIINTLYIICWNISCFDFYPSHTFYKSKYIEKFQWNFKVRMLVFSNFYSDRKLKYLKYEWTKKLTYMNSERTRLICR